MRSRAIASKSARETTPATLGSGSRAGAKGPGSDAGNSRVVIGSVAARKAVDRSADQLEVRDRREHHLATDRRVAKGDGDLLVGARELRGHDDPVAEAAVADAIAVP